MISRKIIGIMIIVLGVALIFGSGFFLFNRANSDETTEITIPNATATDSPTLPPTPTPSESLLMPAIPRPTLTPPHPNPKDTTQPTEPSVADAVTVLPEAQALADQIVNGKITEMKAKQLIESAGFTWRVKEIKGVPQQLTPDISPNRFNLYLESDGTEMRVIRISFG